MFAAVRRGDFRCRFISEENTSAVGTAHPAVRGVFDLPGFSPGQTSRHHLHAGERQSKFQCGSPLPPSPPTRARPVACRCDSALHRCDGAARSVDVLFHAPANVHEAAFLGPYGFPADCAHNGLSHDRPPYGADYSRSPPYAALFSIASTLMRGNTGLHCWSHAEPIDPPGGCQSRYVWQIIMAAGNQAYWQRRLSRVVHRSLA